MPHFILHPQTVNVPIYFIESIMPAANPTFVKIYIYALMLASTGSTVDNGLIASKLGILESDVVGAFSYWQSAGVITYENDMIMFLPLDGTMALNTQSAAVQKPVRTAPASEQPSAQTVNTAQAPNYSASDVAKAMSEDSILAEIFTVAESMLAKPLSTQDTKTLYSFYDWLHFKPEIIILLLDHCISMGKTSMNYIEKVAIAWHDNGLFTAEDVEAYLKDSQSKKSFLYGVRKILGILDRNPTATEEKFINNWNEQYHMSEDMVALAYDICIVQTRKLSMPYMDKIMQRWHENGITTVEAAKLDQSSFKANSKNQAAGNTADADSIRELLGITDRPITQTERSFISSWRSKYAMSDEMIAYAYDLCIMQTQKLSIPYMDKIIANWSAKGIRTIEDAKLANESFKNRTSANTNFAVNNPNAYDYDEIERRMWQNIKNNGGN